MKITLGTRPNPNPSHILALEILGIYPTPKAALCQQFGMREHDAETILNHVRQFGANNILMDYRPNPGNCYGVGRVRGQWVAVWGWPRSEFSTLAQAETFAAGIEQARRREGLPETSWLFLERAQVPALAY